MCKSTSTIYACGFQSEAEAHPCKHPEKCGQPKLRQKKCKESCGLCSTCIERRNSIWIATARSRISGQNQEREMLEMRIWKLQIHIGLMKYRGKIPTSIADFIRTKEGKLKAWRNSLLVLDEQRDAEQKTIQLLEVEVAEIKTKEAAARGETYVPPPRGGWIFLPRQVLPTNSHITLRLLGDFLGARHREFQTTIWHLIICPQLWLFYYPKIDKVAVCWIWRAGFSDVSSRRCRGIRLSGLFRCM